MKFYFAVFPGNKGLTRVLDIAEVKARLFSFAFADAATFDRRLFEDHRRAGIQVLLDSGAFTAWTSGRQIDLEAYIEFISDFGEHFAGYFNLDVIPGNNGRPARTEAEIEQAAVQSYANLQTIKRAGYRPIPIFHMGENPRWLLRMLDDGETRVATKI